MKVFVYDNLKTGGVWHHLLKAAALVGYGYTLEQYPLIVKDGHPYLLAAPGGHQVSGEVYDVDSKTLAAIDAVTANGSWYRRSAAAIMINGSRHECQVYFLMRARYPVGWERLPRHLIYPVRS